MFEVSDQNDVSLALFRHLFSVTNRSKLYLAMPSCIKHNCLLSVIWKGPRGLEVPKNWRKANVALIPKPCEIQEGQTQSAVPGREAPLQQTRLGSSSAGMVHPGDPTGSCVPWQQGQLLHVWTGMPPLDCGKGSFPISQHLWDTASSFEATNARKKLTNWSEFSRDLQAVWELEHLPGEEKLKELDLFSLKQMQLQGQPTAPQYLWEGWQEDRVRPFTEEYGERIRGNGHKLKWGIQTRQKGKLFSCKDGQAVEDGQGGCAFSIPGGFQDPAG